MGNSSRFDIESILHTRRDEMEIKDIIAKEYIVAYKGFDNELKCRGFEFEVGKTYKHKGVVTPCLSGFHSCEYPLDVFNYYAPAGNRFAIVEASGVIFDGGSKIASSVLTIKKEIDLHELVSHAVDWTTKNVNKSIKQNVINSDKLLYIGTGDKSSATNTSDYSLATNSGYRSASTNTGDYSVAMNIGNQSVSANIGNYSVAINKGDYSSVTNTGDYSASTNTGGHSVSANTGYRSVSTNTGYWSASTNTGNHSAATNTGDRSAAMSIGCRSDAEVTGSDSVAISLGIQGRARANAGGAIVLCYRDDSGNLIHIRASKVGENGIKEGVWYTLDANGQFIEV